MRLTLGQRIKRRISLWGGSYQHPDGHIEMDSDEKAGIRRGDSEEATDRKLRHYLQREQARERSGLTFTTGIIVGGLIVYWWLR